MRIGSDCVPPQSETTSNGYKAEDIQELFDMLDVSPMEGYLSEEEWSILYQTDPELNLNIYFNSYDRDQDGMVSSK